ncbi:MAG: hypothetical protein ACTSRZ_10675 [Promethearchaeota archaeon]
MLSIGKFVEYFGVSIPKRNTNDFKGDQRKARKDFEYNSILNRDDININNCTVFYSNNNEILKTFIKGYESLQNDLLRKIKY